jgi:hypothetical protein
MSSALSEIGLCKRLDTQEFEFDHEMGLESDVLEELEGERGMYSNMKYRQKQLELLEVQEEYVRDEIKNLRREILRAQEEAKRS